MIEKNRFGEKKLEKKINKDTHAIRIELNLIFQFIHFPFAALFRFFFMYRRIWEKEQKNDIKKDENQI